MKRDRCKTERRSFAVLGILFWGIFMALHFWVRTDCYGRDAFREILGIWMTLQATVILMLFFGKFRNLEKEWRMNSEKYTIASWGICLFFLIALILEMGSGIRNFSVYGEWELILWSIDIPKKYLFDIYAVIIFPLWTEGVFRASVDAKNSAKAAGKGCLQLISLTAAGYLFFSALPNIWVMELAMVNIVTVAFGFYKYFRKKKYFGKKKSLAAVGIYTGLWCGILTSRWNFEKNPMEYFYGRNWKEYVQHVQILQREVLYGWHSEMTENWIKYRSDYLQQLLFRKGWIPVIAVIFMLGAFLVLIFRMLRFQSFRKHKGFLVYLAGTWILTVRVVMGILYFLGVPYPEMLPFAGDLNIFTDSLIFGLLFRCTWENYYTDSIKKCKAVGVAEYFGDQETYRVTYEDGKEECDGDDGCFLEKVRVWSDGYDILCKAEWAMSFPDGELWIFSPDWMYMKDVFFLEYRDGKWYPVQDEEIAERALKEYKKFNKPDWFEWKYYTKK